MKEYGDFVKDNRTGRIYWIIDIDYENKIYVLEYIVKAGKGNEPDKKEAIAFDFDEVAENFEEEER